MRRDFPDRVLRWASKYERSFASFLFGLLVILSTYLRALARKEIFLIWEFWLQRYIPFAGRVFLDIGANSGQWSKSLSSYYEAVEAFEPNQDALRELRTGLPVNVKVHEVALWSHDRGLILSTFTRHSHTSAIMGDQGINTGHKTGEITVASRRLDQYHFQGVDFIKMDTEGAEVEIMKGALGTINRNSPDILIEIHSLENREWLEGIMPSLGYRYELEHHPRYARDNPLYEFPLWMRAYPEEPE